MKTQKGKKAELFNICVVAKKNNCESTHLFNNSVTWQSFICPNNKSDQS